MFIWSFGGMQSILHVTFIAEFRVLRTLLPSSTGSCQDHATALQDCISMDWGRANFASCPSPVSSDTTPLSTWVARLSAAREVHFFFCFCHAFWYAHHAKINICACLTILPQMMKFWNLHNNPCYQFKNQDKKACNINHLGNLWAKHEPGGDKRGCAYL
jgi:hypothetical protein